MQGTLNTIVSILAFADSTVSSNPRLRAVDWRRDQSGVSVDNPKSEGHTLEVGETKTIFSGIRSTSIASNSAFSLALSTLDPSKYRITYTGGTDPVLRTARSVASTGVALTLVAAANATLTMTAASNIFGAVVAGDEVFIPNTNTGDSSNEFSVINSGYWVVLSAAAGALVLVRPTGQDFEAVSEVVTTSTNSHLLIYSSAGVQVGDNVDITAGFSTAARKTFEVMAVTSKFIEIVSTSPLPAETGITPTVTGMIFYSSTKTFLYLETSQEIAVRVNGDSTDNHRLSPLDSADAGAPGIYMRRGPTWSLVLVNRAPTAADIVVIHCE
jgi:hypothetical protein